MGGTSIYLTNTTSSINGVVFDNGRKLCREHQFLATHLESEHATVEATDFN
jgi:hypothetical protein